MNKKIKRHNEKMKKQKQGEKNADTFISKKS